MESISRVRLQLRLKKLLEAKAEIREKLNSNQITEEDLIKFRITLKHVTDAYDGELRSQTGLEVEEFSTLMEHQLDAEQLQIILISVYENFKMSQTQIPQSTVKLPRLDLVKFNGDILQWSEFWDKFEANIDSRNLKDVEKLTYLLGSLEGQALKTVSGLSATNSNYAIAVDILRKRFGSNDRVIDAHHVAISNIQKASNQPETCRITLDTIEKHLRVLQTLGENVESNHLRSAIASKFPEQLMYQVNLQTSEDYTVNSLRSNLDKIISAMEKSGIEAMEQRPTITTESLHIRAEAKQASRPNKRKWNEESSDRQYKKPKRPCIFCSRSDHHGQHCTTYKTLEERQERLKGRCLRCFSLLHKTEACLKGIKCFKCKGKHMLAICPEIIGNRPVITENVTSETICNLTKGHAFLQTAVAVIHNPANKTRKTGRILLDSGSQRSYITAKTAKVLSLSSGNENLLLIYTFGAETPQEMSSLSTEVVIETKRGVKARVQVNIVPRIADHVPVANFKLKEMDVVADDSSVGEDIDILVGNDNYGSFLRDNRLKITTNLYAIDTDFGWVLSGNTIQDETDVLSVTTYCQCHIPSCPYFTEPDLPLRNIDIKFLWSLESIGITDSPKATRQEEAVSHFNRNVKYENGRYEVKWPWIQYPPNLPSNFGLALGRLRSLIKKSSQNNLKEYDDILREQMELGVIEVVQPYHGTRKDHLIHYLPHHIVQQKGKRGRIVYDASAKTAEHKSLNECLYSGPSMLEDLIALLLKFRTNRIGIVADVEKAFLQVGLQEEDRDVARFLWVKDPNKEVTEENLLHLRFCRVPFGVISSPFLLNATIRHHMTQSKEDLLKTIADKCYVDNLVTGTDTVQEAGYVYEQTRETFEQLAMNIRDWVSNSKEFMDMVPQKCKAIHTGEVKVLGLTWNVKKDTLMLKVSNDHFNSNIQTKREVLCTLARVYDPCGFVCPLILPIKLFFQRICKAKVKWDAILPQELIKPLKPIVEGLKTIMETELPRYIGSTSSSAGTRYDLHTFTDASRYAYSTVVYLRAMDDQNISVSFVMAKSHISQIQEKDNLKIPKLELMGFLIGSRLAKYVKANLGLPIQREYLWTDSLVVLGWMKSEKLLPPFVANRVNEIKRDHNHTEMCYVNTKSNPADIATRPDSEHWNQRKELWFNGPDFLKKEEIYWPRSHYYDEHKTLLLNSEVLNKSTSDPTSPDWSELDNDHNTPMEIDDLDQRELESVTTEDNVINETTSQIKTLQQHHFPDELAGKKTHLTKNLDLFLDNDGVLRCGGRMANTAWSYDMKYPILLPKDSEFTRSVVIKTHETNYHVGASHTLSILRQRYWIPHGKTTVTRVLKSCQQCIIHGGGPYKLPATPALPQERVNYVEPYSFTGIDYFGPVYVNSPAGKEKRWVALFTCLTVRAIHLEIVKDLSAEECLLAIRRFVATRGTPKRVYSDNATCFKLTSEVMSKPYCIERDIQWKFIPQLAPWHGGFYERLVGLVKHCLKRTLQKHLLNDSKLLTVMKEVESVVNTRPLTRVGTEIEHILRPADFLSLGKCLTSKPSTETPCTGSRQKKDLIDGWRKGLIILEEFKKMFVGQYLLGLRERTQHSPKQPRITSNRTPQIGDLVQIKADSRNRENWKVGKIVHLIRGADGECRVAKVKINDSILTRSVGHLYPLEDEFKETPQPEPTVENKLSETSNHVDEITDPNSDSIQPDLRFSEIQSDSNKVTYDSEPTWPIDTESTSTDTRFSNDVEEVSHTIQKLSSSNGVPNPNDIDEPQQEIEVETRNRRDAAVRARQKILEWTRHLLVLLE